MPHSWSIEATNRLPRQTMEDGGPCASVSLTLETLAQHLAMATDGFALLPHPTLRRFFVCTPAFHLSESAFALHLFFQHAQCRIDVVVAHENLHQRLSLWPGRMFLK